MCVVLGKPGLIHTLTAMHGAIVAQEQRKVGFCDSETSNGRSKRAKTLANEAKYSSNRGLYVWSFTVDSVQKNLPISSVG